MKQIFTLFIILSLSQNLSAQDVTLLTIGDTLQKPDYHEFIYIADSTDLSGSVFVAKAKCTGRLDNVTRLFAALRSRALQLGANSFKFESFKKLDAENGELIVSMYYNDGDFFDRNFAQLPKNKIYILGHQNLLGSKRQTYKIDNGKYEIAAGMYREFERKSGETRINKGGFTGETLFIPASDDGYCKFYSFSGIGVNGAQYQPMTNGVGISFNTGKINSVEPNLALALLKIYERAK